MNKKGPNVKERLTAIEGDIIMLKNWVNTTGASNIVHNRNTIQSYINWKNDTKKFLNAMEEEGRKLNEEKMAEEGEKKPTKRSGTAKTVGKTGKGV